MRVPHPPMVQIEAEVFCLPVWRLDAMPREPHEHRARHLWRSSMALPWFGSSALVRKMERRRCSIGWSDDDRNDPFQRPRKRWWPEFKRHPFQPCRYRASANDRWPRSIQVFF